jgi:hypothetical protein
MEEKKYISKIKIDNQIYNVKDEELRDTINKLINNSLENIQKQ